MSNWRFVVQVFVPISKGANEGYIATGYPVAKNLIMTAGHSITELIGQAEEWHDELPVVEVQWRLDEDPATWKWVNAQPVWWSDSDFSDAALLETEFPAGVVSWLPLNGGLPRNDAMWSGLGYPDCGDRREHREDFPMSGRILETQHQNRLDLQVETGPAFDEGWKGASGSPIVVDNAVVGIVRSCLQNVEAKRLRGVLISRLIEESGFRDRLGYCPALSHKLTERKQRARDSITGVLSARGSESIVQSFASEFSIAPEKKEVPEIVERLFGELETVCYAFVRVIENVNSEDSVKVQSLFEELLPLIYPMTTVYELNRQIEDAAVSIVTVPFGNPVGVSMAMAAIDGRQIDAESVISQESRRTGVLNLPEAMNRQRDEDVKSALQRMSGPEEGRGTNWESEVRAVLAAIATDKDSGIALESWDRQTAMGLESLKSFATFINDHLRILRNVSRTRYFYPYHQNNSGVSAEALDFLGKSIPELTLVQISGENVARQRDLVIYQCLKAFMKQTSESTRA